MPTASPAPPTDWRPFAGLNLTRNPFGELSREERAEAAVLEIDDWVAWLAPRGLGGPPRALQLLGDCGRGKTTHLLALRHALAGSAYVHLPEFGPQPAIPVGEPLLIDEAQRLGWRRRRVFRRGATLVLGTHDDLRGPLRRHGYEIQTAEANSQTSAARVRAIMNRRVELARVGPGPLPLLSEGDAEQLFARFGDNVRAIEHYLFDALEAFRSGRTEKLYTERTWHGEVRPVD